MSFMKKIILIVAIIIILSFGFYFIYHKNPDLKNQIHNNLQIDANASDKSDLIVVSSPVKGSEISSPLRISGRARGKWFFEGSFPVELVDEFGNTIAVGNVASQGEWMTEDFVPFLGTLQFNNYIKGQKGTLILKKDNPSDLPENDDLLRVPVIFK